MLDKVKYPINPKKQKGVYKTPCSYGEAYIGEIGCSIKTRLKEHSVDIQHERIKNSATAEHSHTTKHHICLEESRVLAIVPNYYKRKIREAIEIEKCTKNFNRDDGLKLKEAGKPIFRILKEK